MYMCGDRSWDAGTAGRPRRARRRSATTAGCLPDLGFLRDGRLCVTGRHKDVVFVNGRTFHASDLESAVAATPGLPSGAVAVVGSTDPDGGGERVVAFVQRARPEPSAAAP